MFVKLFQQILDSSIADNRRLRHFFTDLLLCADGTGMVMMTHGAIARRIGADLEEVEWGINELMKPDPQSKTPDAEGRRLEAMEGQGYGWRIINYEHYRAMRDAEQLREATRERVRRHRAKKVGNADVTGCNASNAMQKEKKSQKEKEKEKEKAETENASLAGFSSDLPPGLESLEKWFAYKAEKKDKYTPTGRATLIKQQSRYPAHFVAASVEKSISNGWKGLFTEKITDAEAAPFLLVEAVQWSTDEPDFLERMLANRAAAEARERAANAEPEGIQDDGDFS